MIQTLNQDVNKVTHENVILFYISDKIFGLSVEVIKEIIKPVTINKLPLAPSAVEGLIKVREDIYPLVNLETLLGLNHLESSEDDERFVLVHCLNTSVALRVDRVESLTSYQFTDLFQVGEDESSEMKYYTKGCFLSDERPSVYLLSLETITDSLLEEAIKITTT